MWKYLNFQCHIRKIISFVDNRVDNVFNVIVIFKNCIVATMLFLIVFNVKKFMRNKKERLRYRMNSILVQISASNIVSNVRKHDSTPIPI